MNAQERLRSAIEKQQDRLHAAVPFGREEAILALVRLRDRLAVDAGSTTQTVNAITGRRLVDVGGNIALGLCLEAAGSATTAVPVDRMDGWADRFVEECAALAMAEQVVWHCETGFMRAVGDDADRVVAWIATKRAPAGWRERADFDWWARLETEDADLGLEADSGDVVARAARLVDAMCRQLGYPMNAEIDGVSMRVYVDVLRQLVALALDDADTGVGARVRDFAELASALGECLGLDVSTVRRVVSAFSVDAENAVWHAAVPGIAPAPVVRLDSERLVLSRYGLTKQPLLFLTRELRRRVGPDYHTAAHLREDVFRQDLYELFADRRFVTSPARIVLRRDDRKVRTDVDAAVFDRKTGALALFELKSQDPFARSPAELARQLENLGYANRQVSGILDWINRHGADEILNRIDRRTAKGFRVRKVYQFVLGRYLALDGDGPQPDRRAAWGTWPQVLRLIGGEPFGKAGNPIASLFTRLAQDETGSIVPAGLQTEEIALGGARIVVHPSYAAFRAATSDGDEIRVT